MSLAVEIEHKKQNIKNTPLHRHLRNKETTGKPIQSRRPVLLYRLSHQRNICPQFSGKILQVGLWFGLLGLWLGLLGDFILLLLVVLVGLWR